MKYILMKIGCLCCDTPTNIVGVYSNQEEANDIYEKCDRINTSVRYEYMLFTVPDEDYESPDVKRVKLFYEKK